MDAAWVEEALRPGLVQNSYSLLDREDEAGVIPICRRDGLGYTPFSPLAGGWLTGKYRRGEEPPAGSRMTLRPEPVRAPAERPDFDALEAFEALADERGTAPASLAMAWLLAQPQVTAVVLGPRRPEHLRPALDALELRLAPGEVDDARGGVRMSLLVLNADEVEELLTMDACIEAMAEVLASLARDELYQPLRFVLKPPDATGLMGFMPAHRARRAGSLLAEGDRGHTRQSDPRARRAPGRGAPPRRADGRAHGAPERSPITAIRTAAVSAVATRALARAGARRSRSSARASRAGAHERRCARCSKRPCPATSRSARGAAAPAAAPRSSCAPRTSSARVRARASPSSRWRG